MKMFKTRAKEFRDKVRELAEKYKVELTAGYIQPWHDDNNLIIVDTKSREEVYFETLNENEEQELLVRNKWNGKTYKVLETTDKAVTLQREDGTKFTIQKSEYFFNYFEKRVDKVN